ncbi:DUF2513 domain-containing protein [Hydrogenophaga sp. RWCD_12]|uniref:DUF2513 domain-containing protein n=1 Tax=Hydrogenophaga sp. RWCD_12 TaxID=3391190 RepID=UPI00398493C2
MLAPLANRFAASAHKKTTAMQKDWAIIRQILVRLQEAPTLNMVLRPDHFEDFAPHDVAHNMRLLAEAGFIEATIQEGRTGMGDIHPAIALRLNQSGHELLQGTRDDAAWQQIQDTCRDSGKEMTFDQVASAGRKITGDDVPG